MATENPPHLAFFSHPRTGSNLILKILNIPGRSRVLSEPGMHDCAHINTPAIKLKFDDHDRVKNVCEWSEEERIVMNEN